MQRRALWKILLAMVGAIALTFPVWGPTNNGGAVPTAAAGDPTCDPSDPLGPGLEGCIPPIEIPPSEAPSVDPSALPSGAPTVDPTAMPSPDPSSIPSLPQGPISGCIHYSITQGAACPFSFVGSRSVMFGAGVDMGDLLGSLPGLPSVVPSGVLPSELPSITPSSFVPSVTPSSLIPTLPPLTLLQTPPLTPVPTVTLPTLPPLTPLPTVTPPTLPPLTPLATPTLTVPTLPPLTPLPSPLPTLGARRSGPRGARAGTTVVVDIVRVDEFGIQTVLVRCAGDFGCVQVDTRIELPDGAPLTCVLRQAPSPAFFGCGSL